MYLLTNTVAEAGRKVTETTERALPKGLSRDLAKMAAEGDVGDTSYCPTLDYPAFVLSPGLVLPADYNRYCYVRHCV